MKKNSGKSILQQVLQGVIGEFMYSVMYYKSLTMPNAADACIFNYTQPIITNIFS